MRQPATVRVTYFRRNLIYILFSFPFDTECSFTQNHIVSFHDCLISSQLFSTLQLALNWFIIHQTHFQIGIDVERNDALNCTNQNRMPEIKRKCDCIDLSVIHKKKHLMFIGLQPNNCKV